MKFMTLTKTLAAVTITAMAATQCGGSASFSQVEERDSNYPEIENYEYQQGENELAVSEQEAIDGLVAGHPLATGSGTTLATKNMASYLWKGFNHEWLRTVLGFRVPHRVSKLHSFIKNETHVSENGDWLAQANFYFGQNTGVDGNYMKPKGYYNGLHSTEIGVKRGYARMIWTDNGNGATYPQARTNITQDITINLNQDILGYGDFDNYVAVLRGIEMDMNCDDAKQPGGATCNSSGMWPFRYYINLNECSRSGLELNCRLEVQIYRAWTPEKGGLQPFETKPFDDKLDYDLKVYFTVFGGNNGSFNYTVGSEFSRTGMARDDNAKSGYRDVYGPTGYAKATVAMTAFGFELSQHKDRKKFKHLGRYIGQMFYKLTDYSHSSVSGKTSFKYDMQVWVPDTVHDSNIKYFMQPAVLRFNDAAEVSTVTSTTGSLCSNSKPNAPSFSTWKKCGSGDKGPEQDTDINTIWLP